MFTVVKMSVLVLSVTIEFSEVRNVGLRGQKGDKSTPGFNMFKFEMNWFKVNEKSCPRFAAKGEGPWRIPDLN